MSSAVEEFIHERKLVLKGELREAFKGRMAQSTFYNRLNTFVKNKEICEVELKTLWKRVVIDDFRRRRYFFSGRLEGAYIWGYDGKLFKRIRHYFERRGCGRFSFKPRINNDFLVAVSPNNFSENCKPKIMILPHPHHITPPHYLTELSLIWRSGKAQQDINPGEEEVVELFTLRPSEEAEKLWGEPLRSVRRSIEEEVFKPLRERNQQYYEHLKMRERQYLRAYLLGTYPYLTGLADVDGTRQDPLMRTVCSEGFAVIVFTVYSKDAYDRKLYLLHRQTEVMEEKCFLQYSLYEITAFTIRGRKKAERLGDEAS